MARPLWLTGPLSLMIMAAQPALAGDPAVGETLFKKCKACHMAVAPDGTEVVKGGKLGPNLFGVLGRQIGADPAFADKYGPSIIAAGVDGTLWDEALLAAYLVDPTVWLQERTGDASAKSKMSLKLPEGGADVAAYLATLSAPQP